MKNRAGTKCYSKDNQKSRLKKANASDADYSPLMESRKHEQIVLTSYKRHERCHLDETSDTEVIHTWAVAEREREDVGCLTACATQLPATCLPFSCTFGFSALIL